MDFETVDPEEFGRSLTGLGTNLLTTDVPGLAAFLKDVFGLKPHRLSDDFAIMTHGDTIIQLHHDGTYRSYPLLGLIPENPRRGAGVQLYLFGVDPDLAEERATALGHHVLEAVANKPHGLREGTILSPEGYAFSAVIEKVRTE